MTYCQLCGFDLSRNGICVECVENLQESGLSRDAAEEAYLAMAPDEDEEYALAEHGCGGCGDDLRVCGCAE